MSFRTPFPREAAQYMYSECRRQLEQCEHSCTSTAVSRIPRQLLGWRIAETRVVRNPNQGRTSETYFKNNDFVILLDYQEQNEAGSYIL